MDVITIGHPDPTCADGTPGTIWETATYVASRLGIRIAMHARAVVEMLIEFFKQFQHGHAYELATANDGADATMALLRGQYDLIVLDMHMPRMGGLEFLKQIRGLGVTIPVIMITGNQDVRAAAQALSGGVFAYVPKPFDFKHLDHLVALAFATPQPAAGAQPAS